MEQKGGILLIGYGNPGRLDDGLGPALAAEVEKWQLPGVTVDSDYQLTVEDAGDVAAHDIVIFADASVNGKEPFFLDPIVPKAALSFSSHSVEPEALLHMAHALFNGSTRGYALGIRGYEFNEFGERLSSRAASNLQDALQYIKRVLEDPSLLDAASGEAN
jgi:hydrogenase maturation protease